MKINELIKYFLGLIFLAVSLYNFRNYLDYYSSINETKKIEYLFVDKKINIGGRGNSYEMKIIYKDKEHTISLTSKEFSLIDDKIYPTLYESKKTANIFSNWVLKKSLRITIIFFSLFGIAVLPWNKILYRLVNNKRG